MGKGIEVLMFCIVLGLVPAILREVSSAAAAEGDSAAKCFEGMPPPKKGDWLYVCKEKGQTFEQYVQKCRNRKSKERCVLYIQPLGDIARTQEQLIETLREYVSLFFDCKAVALAPIALPKEGLYPARLKGQDQYNADYALEVLGPNVPRDALALAAIADQDLFCKNTNFVFGLAEVSERVGVYSIFRYRATYPGQPKDCTLLKRTLKVASHEIGHILWMEHCICYRCAMNGSNSLPEADRRPIHLCPICLKKLEWNIGLNPLERYKKLRDFYERIGLKEDSAFVARQITVLEGEVKMQRPRSEIPAKRQNSEIIEDCREKTAER